LFNPGSQHHLSGVRVLQQRVSFLKSQIQGNCEQVDQSWTCVLITKNVRRFEIARVEDVGKIGFLIDGLIFEVEKPTMFCYINNRWSFCSDVETYHNDQRVPDRYGPIRQLFESKFVIVYGTQTEDSRTLLGWATFLANTWFMTGHASASIVSDTEFLQRPQSQENVLFLGGPELNLAFKVNSMAFKSNFGINETAKDINIGPCYFSGEDLGAMILFPFNGRLGGVISGTTLEGVRSVIALATPTIPPMARQPYSNMIPDFIVTGPNMRTMGLGGIVAAGFWDYRWDFDEKSAYLAFCNQNLAQIAPECKSN